MFIIRLHEDQSPLAAGFAGTYLLPFTFNSTTLTPDPPWSPAMPVIMMSPLEVGTIVKLAGEVILTQGLVVSLDADAFAKPATENAADSNKKIAVNAAIDFLFFNSAIPPRQILC